MLKDLDRISWSQLHTAYGNAPEVPDLIRALTSTDADEWDEALFTLEMGILHQDCDVTDATAAALPFLVEIASTADMPSRVYVLHFIGRAAVIAVGLGTRRYQANRDRLWENVDQTPEQIAERRTAHDEAAKWGEWTLQSAMEQSPTLVRLMGDSIPAVRLFAAWACAQCIKAGVDEIMPAAAGVLREELLNAVKAEYAIETVGGIRAGLLFTLNALADAGAATVDDLEAICPQPKSTAEQIAKAAFLGRHARSLNIVDVQPILDACLDLDKAEKAFSMKRIARARANNRMARAFAPFSGDRDVEYPWFGGHVRDAMMGFLKDVADKVGDAVMPALLGQLRNYDRTFIPKSLLDLLFPNLELPPVPFIELPAHQQQALEIIFDNLRVWVEPTFDMHDENCVRGHARTFLKGMPTDRPSMAAYLGRPHEVTTRQSLTALGFPWIEHEADLDNRKRVGRVTSISLRGIGSDELMSAIGQFPNLGTLHLDATTPPGSYATLPNHPKLKSVYILSHSPGRAAIRFLTQCHALTDVYMTLDDADWDELLGEITAIPNLSALGLMKSGLTDSHIPWLTRLTGLKSIYLTDAHFTADGEAKLREALPGVDVIVRQ